jgi:hypothetical protein
MKHLTPAGMVCLLLLASCSGDAVKEKINKAGDVAGQAVGELATGVSAGVEKAIGVQVEVSPALAEKGISIGKIIVSDSSASDNMLSIYTVFSKDFDGEITAKVFDQSKAEMGRTKVKLSAKMEDAKFVDFVFDKRTNLDHHCTVIIE